MGFFNMAKLRVVTLGQTNENIGFWNLSQKITDLKAFAPRWGFFDVEHISHIIAKGIS